MLLGASEGQEGSQGPCIGQASQEHSWTCSALDELVYKNFGIDLHTVLGFCSPSPEEGMGDEFDLMDHSDLYILDFST